MADADEPALITLSAHRLRNRRSQRWYQEGRLEEVIILIQLLFKRRFGTPSSELAQQIAAMPLEKGEALVLAFMDFSSLADFEDWLRGSGFFC